MKEDFLHYQAPTSLYPLGLEVARAEGSYIYDTQGKALFGLGSRRIGLYLRPLSPQGGQGDTRASGKVYARNGLWRVCAITSGGLL